MTGILKFQVVKVRCTETVTIGDFAFVEGGEHWAQNIATHWRVQLKGHRPAGLIEPYDPNKHVYMIFPSCGFASHFVVTDDKITPWTPPECNLVEKKQN